MLVTKFEVILHLKIFYLAVWFSSFWRLVTRNVKQTWFLYFFFFVIIAASDLFI